MITMQKWITKSGCTVYQTTKGRGNSYLVLDDGISILVDTGLAKSRVKLMEKLDDLLDKRSLSYLILTHSHYDHVENAAVIKKEYGAKIIIQRNESELIKQGNTPILNGTNFITSILVAMGRRINRLNNYQKVHPDIIVDKEYSLSPNCYLIHTPGHTSGSMSLIVDDEVALVGDAMFGVFRWSVFPPFADNVPLMIRSWAKLLNTGCDIFLPSHGTFNSRKLLEKQYEKYKKKFL